MDRPETVAAAPGKPFGAAAPRMMEPMPELTDTSPEAQRRLDELYRAMTPEQKLRLVFEHQAETEAFALAGIRLRHPHASEREQTLRLAALRLSRDVMVKVFDWDPESQGH